MRLAGTIADEPSARRLADYLLTRQIPAEVRPAGDVWGVWIVHEDQLDAGRRELEAFRAEPGHARYAVAAGPAQEMRQEARKVEREHRRRTVDLRGRLDTIHPARCPIVHILIALSVLAALLTYAGENLRAVAPLLFAPPVSPAVVAARTATARTAEERQRAELEAGLEPIRRGQIWRLFTPMFVHYGWRHLIFNMLALYWFGSLIEIRKGSWTLLGLVLAAAPASFLIQYVWDIQTRGLAQPSMPAGMSGVIYALFGYVWMTGEHDPSAHLGVSSTTITWMLLWLVLCFTGAMGPIANAAHVGGLALGMVVGLVPHLRLRPAEP